MENRRLQKGALLLMAMLTSCMTAWAQSTVDITASQLLHDNILAGSGIEGRCIVRNTGNNTVNSIALRIQLDNGEVASQTFSTSLAPKKYKTLDFSLKPQSMETGMGQRAILSIGSVDGSETDLGTTPKDTLYYNVANSLFPRVAVAEEGTGLWCGWCVRGIVGMEAMYRMHPDDFIGIAVHNNDVLTVKDYDEGLGIKNFPEFIGNRKYLFQNADSESLETFYQTACGNYALANIYGLKADWNADSASVSLSASVAFGLDTSTPFNYALVWMEDSVTGYKQKNSYAGGTEEMGGFEKMGATVSIPMMHVARAVVPSFQGALLTPGAEEGKTYSINDVLTLPDNIQSRKHLSLALLLINGQSGEIVNAAKVSLAEGKNITGGGGNPEDPAKGDSTIIDQGDEDPNGLRYVDLGLSVNWSYSNMLSADQDFRQAAAEETYGGYYGWADPTGLKTSTTDDYMPSGNPTEISSSKYDIARQKWGGSWRLPTHDEWMELVSNTTWKADTINGVAGVRFTSTVNGASIFLPSNGSRAEEEVYDQGYYGAYWTGTWNTDELGDGNSYAYVIDFDGDNGPTENTVEVLCYGLGIRPVFSKKTTGLDAATADNVRKANVYYNLNGQRICKPTQKGIYIVNGKKILIR